MVELCGVVEMLRGGVFDRPIGSCMLVTWVCDVI